MMDQEAVQFAKKVKGSAKMEGKQDLEGEEWFQAQARLFKHIFSFVGSMCLKSALQLGIPDTIYNHGQPITLPELLSALKIDPSKSNHLHRIMRILVHSGLFSSTIGLGHENEEEGYDLTPSSRLLLKDKFPSMFAYAQAVFHPAVMNPPQFLGDWIYSDGNTNSPFHSAFGMEFWSYGSQNAEFSRVFNEGMVSDSEMVNSAMKNSKSVFRGLNSLVDVGGGKGALAMIISEEFPDMKCTVLDLPHVVANMTDSGNLKFVGGDMFEFIPSADAILLKVVLHTLSDEDCKKVLTKCREAISSKGKEGKVIIIDIVINEEKDKHEFTEVKLYFDVMMMSLVNGKERDEKEWEKLFIEAGFTHYKITPIFGLRSLIEVYP